MTKTAAHNPSRQADRPTGRQAGTGKRGYFARFFGLAFGVCGSGGLFNIVRSRLSVRFFISRAGRRSSLAISAARSARVGLLAVIVKGV